MEKNILDVDDIIIMVFAYRYAMGRESTAPLSMKYYIQKKLPFMAREHKENLLKEVESSIEEAEMWGYTALRQMNEIKKMLEKSLEEK